MSIEKDKKITEWSGCVNEMAAIAQAVCNGLTVECHPIVSK